MARCDLGATVAAAVALTILALAGCGDDGTTTESTTPVATAEKRAALRSAVGAYEDYIAAINERDGARLCDLLTPGAERTLKPAVDGGSCAARIGHSIGYEDPRGFPVWRRRP